MAQRKKLGYVYSFYGDGKGKTSHLNGMVIRALGNGWKVCYLRFLKNRPTGELKFFEQIIKTEPYIKKLEIYDFYRSSDKFTWEMNEAEKEILQNEINQGFAKFREITQRDDVDLIVVDEVLDCIYNKYLLKEIPEEVLIDILKNKKTQIEVALSGHNMSDKLKKVVDVISWVNLEKHYFYKGVNARKGIEY